VIVEDFNCDKMIDRVVGDRMHVTKYVKSHLFIALFTIQIVSKQLYC